MIIAGIDPGLSGALAVVSEQGDILLADCLPLHKVAKGNRNQAHLDLATLRSMLTSHPIDHVVIEQVGARPGQGTVSMFRFGFCTGSVVGMIAGLEIPHTFVLPRTWQRAAGVGPGPDDARRRATQLFPGAAGLLSRRKDEARADALLIARWGLLTLQRPREAA